MIPEFVPFPKIARINREIIITEKIDGTNAGIYIDDDKHIMASSRKRWICPELDNYGFAKWVQKHKDELLELGPGMHWGEWWGQGIQRNYHLEEKRFSLFNTGRWSLGDDTPPACCHIVPILAREKFNKIDLRMQLILLESNGSAAAPGYMNPEGIVVYHVAGRMYFKATIRWDEEMTFS